MQDNTTEAAFKAQRRQQILKAAFRLFSERGIEPVMMPEVAEASDVSRATLYRYYASKTELVLAVGTWTWSEYIQAKIASDATRKSDTAAEGLKTYLDSFLDLYRGYPDILRFNYNVNSYLRYAGVSDQQKAFYLTIVDQLRSHFHDLYQQGLTDGTLNTSISEEAMLSGSFHIMLAAVTRYAVGLVYVSDQGSNPEDELVMLEELLLTRYTKGVA